MINPSTPTLITPQIQALIDSIDGSEPPAEYVPDVPRDNAKSFDLRPSQSEAFDRLVKNQRIILNAPTGWGKSVTLVAAASDALQQDSRRKIIFTVPQRIISKGFITAARLRLPTGQLMDWRVVNNLCERSDGKIDRLRQFLLTPGTGGPNDRVIVTTHLSFAAAVRNLTDDELAHAFHCTTLCIDETQHLRSGDEDVNRLGEAVARLLQVDDVTIQLILATAFFFRGDRLPILNEDQLNLFARHHIPFDEYWASLKHLKTYAYDFVAYKATPWTEIASLLKQTQEPTIFFCPPNGHRLHLGRKKASFMRRLIGLVMKHYPQSVLWNPGLSDNTPNVILDLAELENRIEKIDYLMQRPDNLSAVLTVGMLREGADWPKASRVIDLIPSSSDQDRNQRFGRLIRDYPGKKHIQYYSFFPRITDGTLEDQRVQLTSLFAQFHATLVLENAIRPVKIPVGASPGQTEGSERGKEVRGCTMDLLGGFGEQKQEAILRDCCMALIRLADNNSVAGEGVSAEEANREIVGVLRHTHGVTRHTEELAKQIVILLRRRQNVDLSAADLVKAGFDKVWNKEILDGLVLFSGGMGGPTTFREIRQAVESAFQASWQESYEKVAALSAVPESGSSIYWWCTHNKVLYGQRALLADRIKLLESIPWWTWTEGFATRWEKQYESIAVLPQCPEAGTSDYNWVRQQRRLHGAGRLLTNRIDQCEQIPWWSWASQDSNWADTYRLLSALTRISHHISDFV